MEQQQEQPPSSAASVATTTTWTSTMGGAVGQGLPQQPYQSPPTPQPGSVTQYASYAARSQQLHSPTMTNGMNHTMGSPTMNTNTTSSSYAQRSLQAHSTPSNVYNPSFAQMQQPNNQMQPQMQQQNMQPQMQHTQSMQPQSMQQTMQTQQPQTQQPQNMQQPQMPQMQQQNMQHQQNMHQQQQNQMQQQPPQYSPTPPDNQERLVQEATRKVQEHAYYMKQAMEQANMAVALDRAAHMVGELGGPPHGNTHSAPTNSGVAAQLTPRNYYQLYLRALEDVPRWQEYITEQSTDGTRKLPQPDVITILPHAHTPPPPSQYSLHDWYQFVQYCPRVVSRLYLQISVAQLRLSHDPTLVRPLLRALPLAIRCEQNPIRGLFVRHYLLTALKDYLPDAPVVVQAPVKVKAPNQADSTNGEAPAQDAPTTTTDPPPPPQETVADNDTGTVQDSVQFILQNFMEMNKLWVRMQHMLGDNSSKQARRQRIRERNELRLLVGTNLVRLAQLEHVTSVMYGEQILTQILEHVVQVGEPLSQAYLMDCLVQVFPDEYHIETLPILLNVCPRLKDKVNIRTILLGLMDRLAKYLADGELLDESDTNQVKQTLARDSFGMFEDCVQKVYNARGPKLTSKEVIRLQMALLEFSLKCFPGNMEQIASSLEKCVSALRQANASYNGDGTIANIIQPLDPASVVELEKFLSIPLETLALRVLELEHYNGLIRFLPWQSRRQVAISMLEAVDKVGAPPSSITEIEELFTIIEPVIRQDPNGPVHASTAHEDSLVAKLVHLLRVGELQMLQVARTHLVTAGMPRASQTLVAVVFAALSLADCQTRGKEEKTQEENKETEEEEVTPEPQSKISPRSIYVFIQETLAMIAPVAPQRGLKLYLDVALAADRLVAESSELAPVPMEMIVQAMTVYEQSITDSGKQKDCVREITGTLLSVSSLSSADYESLITKTAQFAAKLLKKPDQCELVASCAYLFFPSATGSKIEYSNPQRSLECLQRSLKLADSCTGSNPGNVRLFVDLLEHYVFLFEKKNPLIGHAYITGLAALVREHLGNLSEDAGVAEAKSHFVALIKHIKSKKTEEATSALFEPIQVNA